MHEALIIVSALSVQDPRERPLESREKADEAHRSFQHESSDFLSYVKLWDFYHEQARHLSQNKLRRLCRDLFVSYVRMREWHDIHQQLLGLLHDMGVRRNKEPASYEQIHRSLLPGLLSNLGFKREESEYTGARNIRFHVFPGSALRKRLPKWIMAAQLVETARLYAHTAARIDPAWLETAAAHLVRRSYVEPRWEQRRARAVATEKVTLYGLPVVTGRRVHYGPVDPETSREIFIRHALVAGEYSTVAPFSTHNQQLIAELRELEDKSRRRDILVDDETLYAFFDERVPPGIYSGARFEKWRKTAETKQPALLFLNRSDLMRHGAEDITREQFPGSILIRGLDLPISYRFEPGSDEDGLTVKVPLAALPMLDPAGFEWLVPGLLQDKLVALIKTLPKALRRHFVPAPDFAAACLDAMKPEAGSLLDTFGHHLKRMTGVEVPADAWQVAALPSYLRMRYAVVDEQDRVITAGRDLEALQRELGNRAEGSFRGAAKSEIERREITDWDFGELPSSVDFRQGEMVLQGYPALVDAEQSVSIRVFANEDHAREAHQAGLRRLFMLTLSKQFKSLAKRLPGFRAMCLRYAALPRCPFPGPAQALASACEELKRDLLLALADQVFLAAGSGIRTAEAFEERREQGRAHLDGACQRLCSLVGEVLEEHARLADPVAKASEAAQQDIRSQLERLVYRGFVGCTPPVWLNELPRYLMAVERRLERLRNNPSGDVQKLAQLTPFWRPFLAQLATLSGSEVGLDPALREFHWMLEEFRVSLFAQELGTRVSVSAKRLSQRWQDLTTAERVC